MIFKIRAYLRFLKESNNQHGVHSPFVYDFITKCLYNRRLNIDYQNLKRRFKQLDFTEDSTLNSKRIKLLIRITGYFNPDWVLNFSQSKGMVAEDLSSKNNDEMINLTPSTDSKEIKNNLASISEELSQTFFSLHQKPFCLVFINENYIQQGLKGFLAAISTSLSTQSLIILDGIYYSKKMNRFGKKLKISIRSASR